MEFDDLGPEVVMHVYDPSVGMRGVIVLDSLVRGPAKGGIRMSLSADEAEVRSLARAMTLKCALAKLPFGGGKSGILVDPSSLSSEEKQAYVRSFGRYLSMVAPDSYVAAPDMGMGSSEMRLLSEVAGFSSVTGKPVDAGGLSDRAGSTGFGVFVSVREWFARRGESLAGKTVAVQGFGNVGSHAAKFLVDNGAVLVGVSDSSGAVIDEGGLDVDSLISFVSGGGRLADCSFGRSDSSDSVLFLDVDVLVPAAQAEVIGADNYRRVQAGLISEGANLPILPEFERALEERGVFVIPDVLANAGGVIGSWVEHEGGSSDSVFGHIERIISGNVDSLLDCMSERGCDSREAVEFLARSRIS